MDYYFITVYDRGQYEGMVWRVNRDEAGDTPEKAATYLLKRLGLKSTWIKVSDKDNRLLAEFNRTLEGRVY